MPITCEQTVRQASDHLKTCDACSRYLDQLSTTINMLAVEQRPRLLALAGALDEEAAEDLVQATWERALAEGPGAITAQRLVEITLDGADRDDQLSVDGQRPPSDGGQLGELDPDADTAELFYPQFYGDGPEAGSSVEAPRSSPSETHILSPEDGVTTTELYGVVDAAIAQLGEDRRRLLTLVDIDGLDSGKAAELLGLEKSAARQVLHAARNHVRAALDAYLLTSPA